MRKILALLLMAALSLGAVGFASHQGTKGDDKACTKGRIDSAICDSYDEP